MDFTAYADQMSVHLQNLERQAQIGEPAVSHDILTEAVAAAALHRTAWAEHLEATSDPDNESWPEWYRFLHDFRSPIHRLCCVLEDAARQHLRDKKPDISSLILHCRVELQRHLQCLNCLTSRERGVAVLLQQHELTAAVEKAAGAASFHSHREQTWRVHSSCEHEIQIEPEALFAVLYEVIANAFRFAFPKTAIAITIAQSPSGLAVSISNKGIPLRPGELPCLGKRGWHSAASRSIGSGRGGCGLWLAMNLSRIHGWKLIPRATDENDMTVFTLQLPDSK